MTTLSPAALAAPTPRSGGHPAAPGGATHTARLRGRVTALLVVAIALLSLGDLVMTLQMVTSMGMVEMNPIARAIMSTGDPLLVVLWKVATAGLACGILYRARHRPAAQLGAWVGFLVMVWLTFHWALVTDQLSVHTSLDTWVHHGDSRWIAMMP